MNEKIVTVENFVISREVYLENPTTIGNHPYELVTLGETHYLIDSIECARIVGKELLIPTHTYKVIKGNEKNSEATGELIRDENLTLLRILKEKCIEKYLSNIDEEEMRNAINETRRGK